MKKIIDTDIIAKNISANLKRIMEENDCSQVELSKSLNISKATISSWITGTRIPRMDKIDLLCNYFNVTRGDIMDAEPPRSVRATRVPVYGKVAAGIPIEAVENIIDWEEIPSTWDGEYAALKVKGDSMSPRIEDGDVIIVRLTNDAETGDIVVAMINGQDATVKKLIKQTDGIVLQPLNPSYEPLFFSTDAQASTPVIIWGKVVENRQKF